ncbi:MAG: DUF3027 domain-containing protein [Bifidobacteriaceae bacterium]|nr:DUF3027 domain-containing protein [Bifidobacteriaceae bacterium]MCI1915493.1 DUF3027 domain-containing protein [Bifidobacteriaceae bacterium]
MPQKPNPEAIARAIAVETAEDADAVGDFAERVDLGDNVFDFRFESHLAGYEKWQWAVSLYHDVELDAWTVNESSLIPTDGALMPPQWVPWRERLLPSDLSVTDTLGTEKGDERLEDGFRKTESSDAADSQAADSEADAAVADSTGKDSQEDLSQVVEEYRLSRRRVLSRLGRSQVAQRWYDGPHGPKSLSTKTAGGLTCETCAFFVPLQGELNTMFGVCANKWSPDDGRVVSLDHGCGEHSEIAPPMPESMWPDRKPAYDDLHIDVVKQAPREEAAQVEVIENADSAETESPSASASDATGAAGADTVDTDTSGAESANED